MNQTTMKQQWTVIGVGIALIILALAIPTSIVAYAVTAVIGLLAIVKPKDTLFLLLFYFPLRPFLIEINPSLKLIGDLIIVLAFLHVVWKSRTNLRSIFQFEKFEWAFIIFLLVGAGSAFLTGVSIGAIVFQIRAFVITFLLLYIMKRLGVTKEDVKTFLWMTFMVAMILVLQGILEKLLLRSLFMPEDWIQRKLSPNNATRIYGLINNPNVLAVFLTISAVLTVYLKMLLPKTRIQWVLNVGLVLMTGVWILTYSRGTWIGLVVGIVAYVLLTRKWKVLLSTVIYIVVAFALVTVPVTYGTQWISENTDIGKFERNGPDENSGFAVEKDRIKDTFDASYLELSMKSGRLLVIMIGFEIFKDYPIIGSGFGTFGDSATKSYPSPIYDDYGIERDIYSDNQYIQVIAQTGVVGVILFAVFLLGMLFMFWKYRKTSPYAVPLIAGLIAVFWCGMIYNIWENKAFTMYYYLITGAFLFLVTKKDKLSK